MHKSQEINFVFFGTSEFSVTFLETLKNHGLLPTLIVTVPDKPQGRHFTITPPDTKIWANKMKIPCIQPSTLAVRADTDLCSTFSSFSPTGFDVFIVASYGKIIPKYILDIPSRGTLNIHPSLLPRLRGASPIETSILTENETGVTIIKLDAEMDHGPILAQEKTTSWILDDIPYAIELETSLARKGADMLASILPLWVNPDVSLQTEQTVKKIGEISQDHSKATFCKKINKTDAELNFNDLPYANLRKIRAYHQWPVAYFWKEHKGKKIRIKVTCANVKNGALILKRIIPEGRKEMNYEDFLKG